MLIVLQNRKSGVIQSYVIYIHYYEILIENIPRVHSLPKTIQILYSNNGDSIYEKKVYAHKLLVVTRHNKTKIYVVFACQ